MPTIKIDGNGSVTAETYVRATYSYECKCGKSSTVEINWPERVSIAGPIHVTNVLCPACGSPVVFPEGIYSLKGSRLVGEPDQ